MGDFDLTEGGHYRISVFAGEHMVRLGSADVESVSSGRDLRDVETGEYIGVIKHGVLPIVFRIETGVVAGIEIHPEEARTEVGETQQFTASIFDLHGVAMVAAVDWESSNPDVATVDGTGLATGVAADEVKITATAERVSGSADLTVASRTAPGSADVAAGTNHTCALDGTGKAFCWGICTPARARRTAMRTGGAGTTRASSAVQETAAFPG